MADRITDNLVKELESPENGNRITYDTEIKGFGIRVTAAGSKAFVFNYRFDGNEKRATIGAYGRDEWSVAAARKQAGEWSRGLVKGIDPLAERERARTAAKTERDAATVSDLCDRYIEDHLPRKRPSSQRDDKAIIEKFVRPRLGKAKIEIVQYTDIDKLHRDLKATPYRANRVLALLSKMFNLAIRWRMRPDNPCKGVERFPEMKRSRYLSMKEIEALTRALADYKDQRAANVVRLCLLTGCRRGEAFGATWAQFDLEGGVWTKPGATTKQKTEHRVPLSKGAVALLNSILASVPKDDDGKLKSAYLFPGRVSGKPLSEIKNEWAKIAVAAVSMDVKLQVCEPKTIAHCVFIASQLGLEVGTVSGEAYLVPYGKTCTLVVGYKGIIKQALNCAQGSGGRYISK